MSTLKRLALEALEAGFSPVPVDVKKIAVIKWGSLQYDETRTTREQIEEWFAGSWVPSKATGIAVCMGETNRVILLEVDNQEGYEKLAAAYPSPWRTKSKKGGHVYFRAPDWMSDEDVRAIRNDAHVLFELPNGEQVEIDIRGQGGYPLIHGSKHKSGITYKADGSAPWPWKREQQKTLPEIDPDWKITDNWFKRTNQKKAVSPKVQTLRERMDEYKQGLVRKVSSPLPRPKSLLKPARNKPTITGPSCDRTLLYRCEMRDRALEVLRRSQPSIEGHGGRNIAFRVAQDITLGFNLDVETTLALMLEEWNGRCIPPWEDAELRERIQSARDEGLSVAVGSIAKKYLYEDAYHDGCLEGESCPTDQQQEPSFIHEVEVDFEPIFQPAPEEERLVTTKGWKNAGKYAFSLDLKARIQAYAKLEPITTKKFIFRYMEQMTRCGESYRQGDCRYNPSTGLGGHGKDRRQQNRCHNKGCPFCAILDWADRSAFITREWPKKAFVMEFALERPEDGAAFVRKLNKTFAGHADMKGRWFRCQEKLILFLAPEVAYFAKADYPGVGSLMTKHEYLPILREGWLSFVNALSKDVRTARDPVEAIKKHSLFLEPHFRRTSAGAAADEIFPWLSTDGLRELKREEREKQFPGCLPGECTHVVGKNADGSKRYCRVLKHTELGLTRTGAPFAFKKGFFTDRDLAERTGEKVDEYLDGIYAASVSFSAEP